MQKSVLACCTLLLAVLASALGAAELPPPSPLVGSWRLDQTRSTEFSQWKNLDITLTIAGDKVTIVRNLGWGRRNFTDNMTVDTAKPVTIVPIDYWTDNRHIGAYMGEDHTKRVRAEWLDGRRILRLNTDLVLSTQQGPRAVNVLSDFKASASGSELTLIEIRSSRNRPVVYVFKRLTP